MPSIIKERQTILASEYKAMLDSSEFSDISPDNIEVLISFSKDKYIIFADKDLELDWETTDSYDRLYENKKADRQRCLCSIELLQHRPTVFYLDKKLRIEFVRLLGAAWGQALDGYYELSELTIQEAKDYLQKRNYEISRRWQLIGAFILTLTISLSLTIFKWNTHLLYGSIGALLSIICKTGKADYDCETGMFLNILENISRFVASIISAFIITQLFNLDLVFSIFRVNGQEDIAIILLCFMAGFSERLVPSIISRIEKNEQKGSNESD